jgi:hypothetical protein
MSLLDRPECGHVVSERASRCLHCGVRLGGRARAGFVVALLVLAVAGFALAWVLRGAPAPEDPEAVPETTALDARRIAPSPDRPEPEGETAPAAEEEPPQAISVWETREGTIHLGDDPPPESHELGKVTAGDARALSAARADGASAAARHDLSELRRRIQDDTRSRPIADRAGLPTWGDRDIRAIVASGGTLDVATDWVTNPTMIRVARNLCRYVSAQGDTYDASTVVVRGRQSRILARCKVWD